MDKYEEFGEDVLNFMSVISIICTIEKIIAANDLTRFVAGRECGVSTEKVFLSA